LRLPKINQKVELKVLSGPWRGAYSTYIADLDSRTLSVAQPMVGGMAVPLPRNEEVELEFIIENGDRLHFTTRVLGHYVQVVPVITLAMPSPDSVTRHQLRDFVRLDANIPLYYAIKPPASEGLSPDEEDKRKVFHKSHTIDISGSGAQILFKESHPVGTMLDIVLQLEGMNLPITAQIVRIVQQVKPKEVWLGVRFTKVEERYRERIIRYIFNEQRARRQKGLM